MMENQNTLSLKRDLSLNCWCLRRAKHNIFTEKDICLNIHNQVAYTI